jgi:hypothetical protein
LSREKKDPRVDLAGDFTPPASGEMEILFPNPDKGRDPDNLKGSHEETDNHVDSGAYNC